ncbi:hypothetical protein [uncultured Shewanella sp.]|uniref:hypothetical protein n=1 Tax=uncultured Shewanella sp. TaxID=173975 RepID=UPI00263158DF|nr:hypothetical protein [uncultured Shewanella sp.]
MYAPLQLIKNESREVGNSVVQKTVKRGWHRDNFQDKSRASSPITSLLSTNNQGITYVDSIREQEKAVVKALGNNVTQCSMPKDSGTEKFLNENDYDKEGDYYYKNNDEDGVSDTFTKRFKGERGKVTENIRNGLFDLISFTNEKMIIENSFGEKRNELSDKNDGAVDIKVKITRAKDSDNITLHDIYLNPVLYDGPNDDVVTRIDPYGTDIISSIRNDIKWHSLLLQQPPFQTEGSNTAKDMDKQKVKTSTIEHIVHEKTKELALSIAENMIDTRTKYEQAIKERRVLVEDGTDSEGYYINTISFVVSQEHIDSLLVGPVRLGEKLLKGNIESMQIILRANEEAIEMEYGDDGKIAEFDSQWVDVVITEA